MQGMCEHRASPCGGERLTLVVLTHERPVLLRRMLQYHEGLGVRFLVLDTSAQPALASVMRDGRMDYHHAPQLLASSQQALHAYALRQVQTPFVMFVADDDFLLADALEQCLAFLEDNPGFGYCGGYSLGYLASGTQIRYYLRQRQGPQCHAQEDPLQRMFSQAAHFVPVTYALMRTELLTRWHEQAPTLEDELAWVAQTLFFLHQAKGRVLSVSLAVRALSYPDTELEARIEQKILAVDVQGQAGHERIVQALRVLPELQSDLLRSAVAQVEQCLKARTSLVLQEIFSSELHWPEGSHHSFKPTQYMEMPFYNQAFFSELERIEFLVRALPGGPVQTQTLEALLLDQQERVRPRKGLSAEQLSEQLEVAFGLYPFDAALGQRFLADLQRNGGGRRVQQLEAWLARLEHAQREGAAAIFENSLSGLLYQRLHGWQPGEQQLRALEQQLQASPPGPMLGLVLVDLEGDMDKLQASLDSLLEGAFTRYQICVLTTATPPVATQASDRLHFVRVQPSAWQQALNRLVAAASWEWLLVAENGVTFTPYGLLKVMVELQQADGCRAVYCDELQRLPTGTLTSLYRPGFNLDLLLSSPRTMAQHWLVRRQVFVEVGGYSAQYPQATQLDFILRMIESAGMSGIGHVDELLLISDHDVRESNHDELSSLRRHLHARGYERGVVLQPQPRNYHLRFGHAERPLVSILVPTRDQLAMVSRCVESIFEHTRYPHFEVILIDNQSQTEEAKCWLDGLESMPDARIRVLRYPQPFNFSAMNNLAAKAARGEYLVLLNNDTQVIDANWLDELLNHALRPEVGIVGARLHYPDGTLQHAGVVLGLRGPAEHPWLKRSPLAPSYMGRSRLDQNFSAVTAACLMMRKSVYEQVGGLDEEAFAVSYNDVDLCLKAGQAGYLTVWAHRAVVMHEGSVSQVTFDPLNQNAKRVRFLQEQRSFYQRWLPMLVNDPAYNRNLSLAGNGFEVDDKPLVEPALRVQPSLLTLVVPSQEARLSEAWGGLREVASVSMGRINLQLPELLRMAPDVLVVPGAIGRWDPQALGLFSEYCSAVKVLDLTSQAASGWDGAGPVPEHIAAALPKVDRVLVAAAEHAAVLTGVHGDVRCVPPLLVMPDDCAPGRAATLDACLP